MYKRFDPVYQILDGLLLNTAYEENTVRNVENVICEKVMKMLIDYNLNYKYIGRHGSHQLTAL